MLFRILAQKNGFSHTLCKSVYRSSAIGTAAKDENIGRERKKSKQKQFLQLTARESFSILHLHVLSYSSGLMFPL